MKKCLSFVVLLIGIVFISGCGRNAIPVFPKNVPSGMPTVLEQKVVTFKEPGIESQFTLPTGWTYEKSEGTRDVSAVNYIDAHVLPATPGLSQFVLYNENHKAIGGVSFMAPNTEAERSFDGCTRAWNIESGEGSIYKSGLYLDTSITIANDEKTGIATESCGFGAFIYWVPGKLRATDFYNKLGNANRLLFLQNAQRDDGSFGLHMNNEEFVQLVQSIAKSITLK